MKVVDLFCGCGGMSLGFLKAGYTILAAFDNWNPAITVYRKNFNHNIHKLDLSDIQNSLAAIAPYQADMIIGGPPCQDFSSAGKRDESLGRADLTISFASIITTLKPKWFVMENVERAIKTKTYRQAYHLFKQAGYGLTEKIIDASLCNVPRKRKRLFLIGHLNGFDNALLFLLEKNLATKAMTLRNYFGDDLAFEHYYRHPRSYKRRGIFSIDEPSPTIRGINRPLPNGYPGHPGDTAPISPAIRALTTKERWMIQTFPEHFIFEGSKTDLEQMIGNAVPVKLAEYIANTIKAYIASNQETPLPLVQLSLF